MWPSAPDAKETPVSTVKRHKVKCKERINHSLAVKRNTRRSLYCTMNGASNMDMTSAAKTI